MDLINFPLGKDYEKDSALNELIRGKRIAYVGPAPSIIGKSLGEKIDSYDLVFRTGDPPVGFLNRTGCEKDFGSRTDALVHSFNQHDRIELSQDVDWLKSLKFLFQPMVQSSETPEIQAWFKKIGVPNYSVPDHHIKSDDHWNRGKPGYLYDHLKSLPNTGFIGILTLLNYDVKEIFMAGMTFYNMGKWDGENNYFPEWYNSLKYKVFGLNESRNLHNPEADINHFKQILKIKSQREKITFVDDLENALGKNE